MNLKKCLKGLIKEVIMEEGYQEALEKITNMVRDYIEFLHSMGYELDDNGEIVDSQGKKLILGNDDE
jgi:hypothetical protein